MRNKLFVGNLGRVSKLELQDEFGRFGRLQDVWVSHKPAGFAFVEFLNSKDASECVQALDGRNILGGRLRVEFAKTETAFPAHRKASSRSRSSRPSRRKSPSRGLGDLMLGSSSTRLLPPPKASASMLAPVYSRSPSPLVLLRRGSGGLFYEDRAVYRTWDDATRLPHTSSSLLLPSIRNRSRSPRPRWVYCITVKSNNNMHVFPQRRALTFMDGEVSWVGVWVADFSPNYISGLRRPKNVKFGTKVASSTKMMHVLRFWRKVFNCGKICKK